MSFLESLRKDYHEDKVVPFIGAGLSVPFNVPTWADLIRYITQKYATKSFIREAVECDLESKDFWGAIHALKQYSKVVDQDIQEAIVDQIKERQRKKLDDTLHNYSDLARMNFKLYLTTNYETLLYEYLHCELVPILLKDIDFNTQNLFDDKRVCHLHGFTSNSGSIVISKESYESLYAQQKYDNILKLVTGTKRLLFMGFSFDDQFIKRLIHDHKLYFNGMHYIILSNPSPEIIRTLRDDYGLRTIDYSPDKSSHVEEIRKILDYISAPNAKSTMESAIGERDHSIIVGAGLPDKDQDVEGNLFYRKLVLEHIDNEIIELAKLFYVAADKYIRELRNSGMDVRVIDAIFFKIFTKYKEHYIGIYRRHHDSHLFVTEVHKSLEKINFGRYEEFFRNNKSDENENRGLIHLLANERDDVWWGDRRL